MAGTLLLSILLSAAAPEAATVRRLPPVDRCAADASFAAFRSELIESVERRDADRMLAIVADDISVDFGGGAGRDYFAQTWNLDRPQTSELWRELAEALRLGCDSDGEGGYWAPALFLAEEVVDPFETVLAIRPGTILRARPDEASEAVETLEWDLLDAVDWEDSEGWWKVRMADGREGWLRRSDLRLPVDFRAGFQRIDGRWRMIAFIAGD